MIEKIRQRFDAAAETLRLSQEHLSARLGEAVDIALAAYESGGGLFIFGNGGSAADAQHIACELVGRFLIERRPLKAFALSTDTSVLTALGNDYGFEDIFARQLRAACSPADVAIALSTSGDSPNVVAALTAARQIGMKTIAFTGEGGGRCGELADVLLDVPCQDTPRVQEVHVLLYHIFCELIEEKIAAQ